MKHYYAGIGSREAPADVLTLMENLGAALGAAGYVLRSGGADGADTAFELGAIRSKSPMEIYLPWKDFNGNMSTRCGVTAEALSLAQTLHPAWEALGQGPRKMHARNCFQVLGQALNEPVDFVVCWTPDGCESEKTRTRKTGGTATGIVLALRRNRPVFNLKNSSAREALNELLTSKSIAYQIPFEDDTVSQGNLF